MKIRSITLGLTLILLGSINILAQKKGNIDDRIEKETQIMVDELQLNDKQASEVLEINTKYGHLMAEARKSSKGNRNEMRSQMKELHKEHNQSLKKVLTEEQFQKHLKAVEEKRKERKQNGPPSGNGRR